MLPDRIELSTSLLPDGSPPMTSGLSFSGRLKVSRFHAATIFFAYAKTASGNQNDTNYLDT